MGVKRIDRLQAPGLALLAFGLGPDHGLMIGSQDQPRAGIGKLCNISGIFGGGEPSPRIAPTTAKPPEADET